MKREGKGMEVGNKGRPQHEKCVHYLTLSLTAVGPFGHTVFHFENAQKCFIKDMVKIQVFLQRYLEMVRKSQYSIEKVQSACIYFSPKPFQKCRTQVAYAVMRQVFAEPLLQRQSIHGGGLFRPIFLLGFIVRGRDMGWGGLGAIK